jgi:peptide/nickel transport system permease protein
VIAYIGRRVLAAVPVVILATIVVFALVSARGDPLGQFRHRPGVSPQTLRNLEHQYHLDESKPQQYADWLGDFVRGRWGRSFHSDRRVSTIIGTAFGNTVLLVGTAVILSIALALLIGVVSAVRQYSAFDHFATGFSYFGYSMPDFWFGLVLQLVLVIFLQEQFGIRLFYVQGKYSVGHRGDLVNLAQHMVLPVLTLALTGVAAWSRFQRDSMLDVLHSDYVRTAKAKGASRRRVVWKHGLRNALIPFVTVVAIDTGGLLGGVVVVERIFSWPGLGTVFLTALGNKDYPVLLAWMAVATIFVVLFNLLADVLYGLLDPRIRLS